MRTMAKKALERILSGKLSKKAAAAAAAAAAAPAPVALRWSAQEGSHLQPDVLPQPVGHGHEHDVIHEPAVQ